MDTEKNQETSMTPNGGIIPERYQAQNEQSNTSFFSSFGGNEGISDDRTSHYTGGFSEMYY